MEGNSSARLVWSWFCFMDKISLIIPIYNTEKYLRRCLDSACNQTYKNMEIICIDDGSTDDSGKIADEYGLKYPNVRVIHQHNKGESAARNKGLEVASGDYIGFMDCDDWIEPDMYEKLITKAIQNQLDIVLCSYSKDSDCDRKIPVNDNYVTDDVFGRKKLFEYVYIRDKHRAVTSWIWCKLFSRELIYNDAGYIGFDQAVRFGADILFFIKVAAKVRRACYINEPLYHYYQRQTSTSHTQKLDVAYEIVPIYERMIDFCNNNNIEPEIVPWLERFTAYRATLVAAQAYEQKNETYLIMCQNIMKKYEESYRKTNTEYPDRIRRYNEILNYKL